MHPRRKAKKTTKGVKKFLDIEAVDEDSDTDEEDEDEEQAGNAAAEMPRTNSEYVNTQATSSNTTKPNQQTPTPPITNLRSKKTQSK